MWASPPPSPARKEQGPPPPPAPRPRAWGPCCPTLFPSPTPASALPLGFHGDQEAASSAEEEAVSKATCYFTNWLGLKFSGYQGRGLGMEEWGSCVFLLKTPALPATCPPQGLAVMERVVATTTSMRSTEKGLNCLSNRRMNSCLRR